MSALSEEAVAKGREQRQAMPLFHRFLPRSATGILRPRTETLVLGALLVFVGLLSLAPLLRLVATALAPAGNLDLSRLARLVASTRVAEAAWNTAEVALASTLLAVALGTAAALAVCLSDMRAKTAWVFAFILPLMIPPQVTALAWVQALSPSSLVLRFLGIELPFGTRHPLYSEGGIVLLLGLYNTPLVFLAVRASLARLPGELVEAARASGAGPLFVLRTVVLPLARAGVFAGAALSFVSSAGNFGIQALLGIPARFPTLITLIYQRLNALGPGALPDMAVLSLLLAALITAALMLNGWLGRRHDQRVEGTARRVVLPLGHWRRPAELFAWVFLAATLVLPLSALFSTSLVTGFGQPLSLDTLTLANYASALYRQAAIREAFFTSLWISAVAAATLMAASLLLGYFLTWHRSLVVQALQITCELTYALPGVVIAIAAILFFLRPLPLLGISLYGTVGIILAAYLASHLAVALRPTLSGLAQIDRSLEEAAQSAGAGFLTRFRDIIAPLAAPSAAAGGIIVFLSLLNEIQVSILLVSSGARTIGPTVVFLEEGGSSTLAAAVGCLMVVIILALMTLASLLSRWLPKGVLPWQAH
ncbi:ABC transporter permease [Radicibacter daui]|uniref:ABC transporter permease n=1 Tax=Radicibacter daui TaxID=3064829 RepID=UPI004046EE36